MSEKKQIPLRIKEGVKNRLLKEAEKQDLSMNKIVERLLDKHLPKLK